MYKKAMFTSSIIISSFDFTRDELSVCKLIIRIIITGLSLFITHCEILTGAQVLFFRQYLVIVSANSNDGCMSEHLCLYVVFVNERSHRRPNVKSSGQSVVEK